MKRLIIALAAVGAAIGAHAAAANWAAVATNIYDGKGDTAAKYTGTAYLFDAATYTQAGLYASFADGLDITGNAIKSVSVANGAISAANGAFSFGEQGGGEYSFFFAILEDDAIYLSKTVASTANGTATTKNVGFGSQAPTTGATSRLLPTDGFVGVGQWAAVPEPTSGLLLILGMAGLTLKRKCA